MSVHHNWQSMLRYLVTASWQWWFTIAAVIGVYPFVADAQRAPFLVKDINPGLDSSAPADLTNVNGILFFRADDGIHGVELWKSDGTAEGTVLVADISPGPDASVPADLTHVNGTLFFRADDGIHGAELWKSDGTAEGTILVADINPGPGTSFPSELTNVNGTLFFHAADVAHGTELWKSDGTYNVPRNLDSELG